MSIRISWTSRGISASCSRRRASDGRVLRQGSIYRGRKAGAGAETDRLGLRHGVQPGNRGRLGRRSPGAETHAAETASAFQERGRGLVVQLARYYYPLLPGSVANRPDSAVLQYVCGRGQAAEKIRQPGSGAHSRTGHAQGRKAGGQGGRSNGDCPAPHHGGGRTVRYPGRKAGRTGHQPRGQGRGAGPEPPASGAGSSRKAGEKTEKNKG